MCGFPTPPTPRHPNLQLLRLPGPYVSTKEGAEGEDGVARLSGEMRGEVPQKHHQEPEVQPLHICAWGESARPGTTEPVVAPLLIKFHT